MIRIFLVVLFFFFFKQKTAYEILTCDWSSDVCSSDLIIFVFLVGIIIRYMIGRKVIKI